MVDRSIPSTANAPLRGVRVVDLTRVLAGPYCTMVLADLGAEVVKIERPEVGDDARHFGPFLPSGLSAYFAGVNRGKKSVVLDLRSETDQRTFRRLVDRADVLVENFRPGTMARFGLAPETLRQANPRLIYASASGFGRHGPGTERAAYDIVIQALSGLMSVTGTDAAHPVRVGTSFSDLTCGLFTTIGILAALREREQSGTGADLDLSMLDCSVAMLENAISRFDVTGKNPEPLGSRHPSITPFQAFEASDGSLVVAAGNQSLWRSLCRVLECPDLAESSEFHSNEARTANRDALEAALGPRFRSRTVADWLALLDEAGVPAAPIRPVSDVVDDPLLNARDMLHRMDGAQGETFRTAGSPLRMNGAAPSLSTRAPELGEHTESVLRDWLDES